jgi:hypothetical protein
MFFIYKCYDDGGGNLIYNVNSIIGIFTNLKHATNELVLELQKLKYTFDINDDFTDNYVFITVTHKNSIPIHNNLCFEIKEKNIEINEIKIR